MTFRTSNLNIFLDSMDANMELLRKCYQINRYRLFKKRE